MTTATKTATKAAPETRAAGPLPTTARPAPTHLISKYALVGILALLLIACLAFIPEFRSWRLIGSMVNTQSVLLLLALTATIVLRTGDFDLSIPQVMIASAVTLAVSLSAGVPPLFAVLLALALGLAIGALNGFLVVKIGVDSFVVTLGTATAMAGVAYLLSSSRIVTGVDAVFVDISRSSMLGLPMITWYAWLLVVVLYLVYEWTPLGRYMLFIGGNRNAARLAGLRVTRVRIGAFTTSGLLAALIGIIFAGYMGAVDPSVGGQYMLQPMAAVFLGATTLTVGRFNAFGTLVALYLLTVGITGLQILGAQTWITNIFYGVALVAAITAAKLTERAAAKGAAR